ncbi:hypothetical protein B0I35DRAFT_491682 [Stachybotrys elegans]|uniref:BTB domain-containing protein n=1 Tax=Stachybotrys elegans TaxID=80388 RepID=A0A8K0SM28_9HYPO|nr:hypothetical protein B0I35DRAFT_491682 [Stachybotrys elegans]
MAHDDTPDIATPDTTTTDIAAEGDVLLVVGPDNKQLRVHSAFLQQASSVFKTMFKPIFKEGRQFSEAGSVTIPLPEDDAYAMEVVLNVIHGRYDNVPESLDPKDLLQAAVIIDKYDCFTPLTLAIRTWFSSLPFTDVVNTWTVAQAALILDRHDTFDSATRSLVMNHSGSFLDLAKAHTGPIEYSLLLEVAVLEGDWHCHPSKKGKHQPDRLVEFMSRLSKPKYPDWDVELAPQESELRALDAWPSANSPDLGEAFQVISSMFRSRIEDDESVCLSCITRGGDHRRHARR